MTKSRWYRVTCHAYRHKVCGSVRKCTEFKTGAADETSELIVVEKFFEELKAKMGN